MIILSKDKLLLTFEILSLYFHCVYIFFFLQKCIWLTVFVILFLCIVRTLINILHIVGKKEESLETRQDK